MLVRVRTATWVARLCSLDTSDDSEDDAGRATLEPVLGSLALLGSRES